MDQEIVIYFDIVDENLSALTDRNLQRCWNPALCRNLMESRDEDYIESNIMHAINGYMFGHLPNLVTQEGTNVAWYFFSLNLGIHIPAINGQTMTVFDRR